MQQASILINLASLRYELGEAGHEYEYIDGGWLWPPAPGIQKVFGKHACCYSYFDGSSSDSILDAVKTLKKFVSERGPFDGVVGFSQGAVLAATLIISTHIESGLQKAESPFRFAIFLCGGLPFDYAALLDGQVRLIEPDDSKLARIKIPVVNSWASNDQEYPGMGPPLAKLCATEHNRNIIHSAGHGVPAEGDDLKKLSEAVTDILSLVDSE